ncbi:hypothetical protein CDV36_001057 [Fusarium kuroshium]|uniref:GPI inositol-deacylase winged helix domain-containing protein n=1 Tax=Fusarium kuroshium TaxID=2010991 RepID=A0A3M2SNV7_9HYPO|nr:hypothetical protein CDV36_001057 [Fusarium kuroshium]
MRISLDNLIRDTESFYREALQRIEDQGSDDKDLARRALSFIFYAKRPLKLQELLHALAVEPGDKDLDRTALTEKHILLSVTAGLLLVDQQTKEVRLVHPTLHDYLEKKSSIHFLEPETSFAIVCLTYLCFEPFKAGPSSGAGYMVEDDEGWTALHWAVINGYDELVKLLLKPHSGLSPDETQINKALILAAEAGSSKTTKMLLQQKDEEGSTALHWAIAAGHEQTSALLLKNKADANSRDNFDNTPLHWAIPYAGITRLLLEHGEAATELLVRHRANANAQDKHGVTPLHGAVLGGHEAVVNLLLLNGANANLMDEDGWTPLHAAIVKKHSALQNQLAPETQNKSRFVDQMHKRMNDENERALLEEMAEKKSHGSTVVSGLRSAVNSGYRQRVLALLDDGADIDAQDQIGDCTALTHAAWLGRDDFVELLLENGADPNRREQHGRTALHIAVKHGYSSIVTMLVDHGADIDARVHSWTPLLLAAKHEWFQIPDYLVKKGADVNAADYHGRTALHWAAHHSDERLAELLLQRGADVNAKDRWGKTALQWAVANGKDGMVELLGHAEAEVS